MAGRAGGWDAETVDELITAILRSHQPCQQRRLKQEISPQKSTFLCPNKIQPDLKLLTMSDLDPNEQTEAYLTLLNENERKLAVYVHALVPDFADAEDILQACRLTMWKKFATFKPGTSFPAWGKKIALNQILNYRRSAKRKPLHTMDPEFIESVAKEIDRQSESLSQRSEALQECLGKLPENQRQTVVLRYYDNCGIDEIARTTGRTEGAVYRLLSRIRASLNECISARTRSSA